MINAAVTSEEGHVSEVTWRLISSQSMRPALRARVSFLEGPVPYAAETLRALVLRPESCGRFDVRGARKWDR
jgi:hypothetical protein